MSKNGFIKMTVLVAVCLLARGGAVVKAADGNNNDSGSACNGLPSHAALRAALVSARTQSNGGFNLDMWGTIVNRDGIVCEVAFTGAGSRIAVAGEPGDFGAEGEYSECVQLA